MIRLMEQQALSVHEMMIKATGGSGGVRDIGLLQSALNAPFKRLKARKCIPRFCPKRQRCAVQLYPITLLLTEISGREFMLC